MTRLADPPARTAKLYALPFSHPSIAARTAASNGSRAGTCESKNQLMAGRASIRPTPELRPL